MIGKGVCVASAVIGQGLEGEGPETDPQGSPEGAWSEGEAGVRGQAARGAATEAWARDVSLVVMMVGLVGQEAEPE